jgi:hypothetical protein
MFQALARIGLLLIAFSGGPAAWAQEEPSAETALSELAPQEAPPTEANEPSVSGDATGVSDELLETRAAPADSQAVQSGEGAPTPAEQPGEVAFDAPNGRAGSLQSTLEADKAPPSRDRGLNLYTDPSTGSAIDLSTMSPPVRTPSGDYQGRAEPFTDSHVGAEIQFPLSGLGGGTESRGGPSSPVLRREPSPSGGADR